MDHVERQEEGFLVWRALVIAIVVACDTQPAAVTAQPAPSASAPLGSRTMIFVHVDGPLDDLRGLVTLPGLHLQRGVKELGGGRFRATGVVDDTAALEAIRATGVTVTVTLDEDEVKRRVGADHEMMKAAEPAGDSGANQASASKPEPPRKP